jgi:hypothetical protein
VTRFRYAYTREGKREGREEREKRERERKERERGKRAREKLSIFDKK